MSTRASVQGHGSTVPQVAKFDSVARAALYGKKDFDDGP